MQDVKLTRRVVGMLARGLKVAQPELVTDPRAEKGRQWELLPLLNLLVASLMAGRKSLAEVEELSGELTPETRRRLKLKGKVPDTTLRDVVVRLQPEEVGGLLRRVAQSAYRSKALVSDFPLNVVTLDGKATALEELNSPWAQTHRKKKGLAAYGLVRTITCTLVTALTRPILEVVPMGSGGNEMGFFRTAYAQLLKHHRATFDVITYDAGANCATNAKAVVDSGKDYVLALKDENRFLMKRAMEVLGTKPPQTALGFTEDTLSKRDNIRVFRYLHLAEVPTGYKAMKSVRTVLRVHTQKVDGSGKVLAEENHFYISSLLCRRLTPLQWLELVRRHWGVEVSHNILDTSFQEDDRPYLTHSAQGMLVMLLLRRLAYNLLTLWKGHTLTSDDNRRAPWKLVFSWVQRALEQADEACWANLRDRKACPAFS
jgi:hypothetical protein